jgi:hypothetical protein
MPHKGDAADILHAPPRQNPTQTCLRLFIMRSFVSSLPYLVNDCICP